MDDTNGTTDPLTDEFTTLERAILARAITPERYAALKLVLSFCHEKSAGYGGWTDEHAAALPLADALLAAIGSSVALQAWGKPLALPPEGS